MSQISPLRNVKLHLVNDIDGAVELMSWLGTTDCADVLGVDTETTGLGRQDRVRLFQVGGREHGWAFAMDEWRGLARDIVKRYEGRFVLHNAPFDRDRLRHDKIELPVTRIHDTRPMSHILTPNVSNALKNQAAMFIDPAAPAAQASLDDSLSTGRNEGGWTWKTVPVEYGPYWRYGALDPVLTVHLYDHHWPLVQTQAPAAYDLELAVQWVTNAMEQRGAHVDVDFTRTKYHAFNEYVDRAEQWVIDTYGVKPGSNQAIVRVLQDEGVVFLKKTDSGAIALDRDVLESVDHPLAHTVLKRRQLQKLASTYLRNFMELADENGNIHPSINTLGARTSRMSMSNPNLQNLPRKSDDRPEANVIRNCITARDDHVLIMCDFDQIEMRILAHLSRDPGLIAAFNGPNDFFVTLARQMFHDPELQKSDPRRQITKNAGYSEIYGAGVAKFAHTANISMDEAAAVKQRWVTLYGKTKEFARQVEKFAWQAQSTGGVPFFPSPITGRRHVADRNKIYALLNYLIQGSAAELFKLKLLSLAAAGLDRYMILPVHDEIILDVPLTEAAQVAKQVLEIMNDYTTYAVPITASVSYGTRWGEKRDFL